MKSFVSDIDVTELKKHGINYEEDIIVFLNEMKQYFYKTWSKDYHKDVDNMENTIEDFNKLIGGYPSNGGYEILSNSFDGSTDEELEILSEKTIGILGYFYHIYLH
jgi:hypothetical protein